MDNAFSPAFTSGQTLAVTTSTVTYPFNNDYSSVVRLYNSSPTATISFRFGPSTVNASGTTVVVLPPLSVELFTRNPKVDSHIAVIASANANLYLAIGEGS